MDDISNVLVIAPHADDEAFGCGGTIARLAARGAFVQLLVVALGDSLAMAQDREKELKEASKILGVSDYQVLFRELDAHLDHLPVQWIVSAFDQYLSQREYQSVFFPYPSHHQDHKIVQQAMISALRPGSKAHIPEYILMYEYTYPSWSNYNLPDGKFYVDITPTMDEKRKAITAYKSQLKSFPHPVSLEAATSIAKVRGMAVGVLYAEMFYVVQIRSSI